MSMESEIYAILTADATLQPLIGTRVFPDKMPQNLNLAATGDSVGIVYQRISTAPAITHSTGVGNTFYTTARVQIACYARTHIAMIALAAAVRAALNGIPSPATVIQAAILVDEREGWQPDPEFYRRDLDFEIEFTE